MVLRNLETHLPFMATETVLMRAVERGGRGSAGYLHEKLRQGHAFAAAQQIKEGGESDLDSEDRGG